MNYKLLFLFVFLCFLSTDTSFNVFAQTATKSATPTTADQTKNLIDNLKDRIASRVAQLNLVEKRGMIGVVTDITHTQITLSDLNNKIRYVDVDEITKFASASASDEESFGISDIQKGTKLGILGNYNKQSRRILARFVDVITIKHFIPATITGVDQDNFTITFVSKDKKKYIADVERATKTLAHSQKEGFLKSGFSKITPGSHVIVIGFEDVKDPNRIIASRILLFPQLPKNPEIEVPKDLVVPTPSPTDESPTSTGSGKKLTPVTR